MNLDWKKNQVPLQVLLGVFLCIFLAGLFYVITFRRPSVLGLEGLSRVNGTRTAIALTARALYGPFPTATGPTPTITKTPTVTPSPTITPSNTPSPTPLRFFINTPTPRAPSPNDGAPSISSIPTNPPSQPTQPPAQPTQAPPQPTQPPPQPTQAAPQPTQPPPAQPTKQVCLNPQGHPIPCH